MQGWSWVHAFALFLIIEGLMPMISPGAWRRGFQKLIGLPDSQIRLAGMISVLVGVLVALAVS